MYFRICIVLYVFKCILFLYLQRNHGSDVDTKKLHLCVHLGCFIHISPYHTGPDIHLLGLWWYPSTPLKCFRCSATFKSAQCGYYCYDTSSGISRSKQKLINYMYYLDLQLDYYPIIYMDLIGHMVKSNFWTWFLQKVQWKLMLHYVCCNSMWHWCWI